MGEVAGTEEEDDDEDDSVGFGVRVVKSGERVSHDKSSMVIFLA